MLTASQKIQLQHAHNEYTVRANAGFGEYSAKETSKALSAFVDLCHKFEITSEQGEQAAWDATNNYYHILWEAIQEGYTNEYITDDALAYIEREAMKEAV